MDAIPLWMTLPRLKRKFWNDEIVLRIASTLSTPLNEQFSFTSDSQANINLVVVVDVAFNFPRFTGVIVEQSDGTSSVENVVMKYPSIPLQCHFCSEYGHYKADCMSHCSSHTMHSLMLTFYTITDDR